MIRLTLIVITLVAGAGAASAGSDNSGFGKISIPSPTRPAAAEQCVEPVDVMRREHMKFLDHQRDATVIDGDRGSKYSLVGCMNCHNPAAGGEAVRYEDPQHFCAECHRYTGVRIDCFECHADRGLESVEQSRLPWEHDALRAATLARRLEAKRGD